MNGMCLEAMQEEVGGPWRRSGALGSLQPATLVGGHVALFRDLIDGGPQRFDFKEASSGSLYKFN
jgi:hypothetical protein